MACPHAAIQGRGNEELQLEASQLALHGRRPCVCLLKTEVVYACFNFFYFFPSFSFFFPDREYVYYFNFFQTNLVLNSVLPGAAGLSP